MDAVEVLKYTGVLETLRGASSLYDEDGTTAAMREDRTTLLASEAHRMVDRVSTDTLGELLTAIKVSTDHRDGSALSPILPDGGSTPAPRLLNNV